MLTLWKQNRNKAAAVSTRYLVISSSPQGFQAAFILEVGFSNGRSRLQRTVQGSCAGELVTGTDVNAAIGGVTSQLQPRMGIWMSSITALGATVSQDVKKYFSACQD